MEQQYQLPQIEYRLLSTKDWPDIKDSVLKLEEELFSGTDLQEDDESFARTFTSPDLIAYAAEVGNHIFLIYHRLKPVVC